MDRDNMATALIEAKQLRVILGGRQIIDIPSFSVYPNEVVAVIGPNGSGKTTLLLTLALLLKPAGGEILYHGQPVVPGSETLKLRRRFAVLFQEPLLLSGSAWDNVTLGLRIRGVNKDDIKTRARKWLERFGVAGLAKRQVKTLSGGEAKRVSLARAFVLQPEILFLDEPFNALDSPTRQSLLDDFESVVSETKVTTVMITHDRNEALALADRVAVLINGNIRQIGKTAEVFSYPSDEEVAGFIEVGNVLPGVVDSQSDGIALINIEGKQIAAATNMPAGTNVIVLIRHEDITLISTGEIKSSALNRFNGTILKVFPVGFLLRVTINCGFSLVALITKRSWEDMRLTTGQKLEVSFKATSIHVIPKR